MSEKTPAPDPMNLLISPEPEGDEGEALIAAISVYLAMSQAVEEIPQADSWSRWQAASRQDGIRGAGARRTMGWGRRGPGW